MIEFFFHFFLAFVYCHQWLKLILYKYTSVKTNNSTPSSWYYYWCFSYMWPNGVHLFLRKIFFIDLSFQNYFILLQLLARYKAIIHPGMEHAPHISFHSYCCSWKGSFQSFSPNQLPHFHCHFYNEHCSTEFFSFTFWFLEDSLFGLSPHESSTFPLSHLNSRPNHSFSI